MTHSIKSFRRPILIVCCAVILCCCEDVLPEHRLPEDVFTPFLASIDTSTVVYHEADSYHKGLYTNYNYFFHPDSFLLYVLSDASPAHAGLRRTMSIEAYLVNTHDETLEGKAEVRGEIVLWPTDNPTTTATLSLSNTSIASPQLYSTQTGILTVAPGERLYLRTMWGFRFDDQRWLHECATAGVEQQISAKVRVKNYSPLPMSGRMTVRLFSGIPMEVLSFSCTLTVEGRLYTIGP